MNNRIAKEYDGRNTQRATVRDVQQYEGPRRSADSRIKCFTCNKPGHRAKECYANQKYKGRSSREERRSYRSQDYDREERPRYRRLEYEGRSYSRQRESDREKPKLLAIMPATENQDRGWKTSENE